MTTTAVKPAASAGTFETIKNTTLDAINWMGRKVSLVLSTIKDYALKVAEYVKPFFQKIGRALVNSFDKVKEFVVTHKEFVVGSGIAVIVGILSVLVYNNLCGKKEDTAPSGEAQKPEATQTQTNKA